MILKYQDDKTGAELRLILQPETFDHNFFTKDQDYKPLTIAWNKGKA